MLYDRLSGISQLIFVFTESTTGQCASGITAEPHGNDIQGGDRSKSSAVSEQNALIQVIEITPKLTDVEDVIKSEKNDKDDKDCVIASKILDVQESIVKSEDEDDKDLLEDMLISDCIESEDIKS